jgi:TrmH family RNA methyltransferase
MISPHIRVVLVRPTHPGNIGAAARAMKTMGLRSLALVEPCAPRDEQARAMAANATDVLDTARVYGSLDEAIRDCAWVVGTSARHRRIEWPELTPGQAADELLARSRSQPVAMLFGQERAGLTNEELDRCQAVVTIPADPDYSSLNVAAAVQILAYEISKASLAGRPSTHRAPLATHEDMRYFYRHLQEVLIETGFLDPRNPRLLMRRLVRLFNRAAPDDNELNILRGILTEIQRTYRRK